ncbi:MAG: exonuclease domain-containing protein [Planctomycetota bacterium]|nr:exonuclease domain-containing protein [Planctomycetota bacterium]
MEFVAIDFETANADLASICQIGAVVFQDGKAKDGLDTLVNPEDYFDGMNVSIHGITEEMVQDAPTFPQIHESLSRLLAQQIVVCHTSFDRVAIDRAVSKHKLSPVHCVWLDTAKVARRTWPQIAHKGYGLKNVTSLLGIDFEHHVAREDARAAGEVLLRAMAETGMTLDEWLVRVRKPISSSTTTRDSVVREGSSDGPLAGEVIVFTGALSMVRSQAADFAANAGAKVAASVNKETSLLVVGDQDIRRLAGHEKSSKHRKAEELIGKGQVIRIIGETDFLQVVLFDFSV